MMILILLILALFGAPMFAILSGGTLLGLHNQETDLQAFAINFFQLADIPVLVALPLFTLAGYILGESGAPKRLVNFSNAWLGWMPGGLAIVGLIACAFFTALSGGTGVTIIALGGLLYPAMQQAGYTKKFTLGLITTSGGLGLLFAPSLPIIIYGAIAQIAGAAIDIKELFIAGLIPGLLMVLVLSLYSMHNAKALPRTPFDLKIALNSLVQILPELPLPFVILGGIFGGLFAPSEAAAITIAYVLVLHVGILREIKFSQLLKITREAMSLVGAIILIIGVAQAFATWLIDAEIPSLLFDWIKTHVQDRNTFLILLNIFLLFMGAVIEIFPAIVIGVPLILPLAAGYQIDPLHLGILFLTNMQLGYYLPPLGLSLVIASIRFKESVLDLCRATLPFFLLLLACLLLITYVPDLSLWLVKALR